MLMAVTVSLAGPITVFAAGPEIVDLGSAGDYAILAKTGISTTGSTAVVGDIGVSPIAASAITGFALTLPAAGAFSTSALVTGKVYASDYAEPTPANLTTAIDDMQNAFTGNIGRLSNFIDLLTGNIGGQIFAPNIYKWTTDVRIPADLTLSGGAEDVWIFLITRNLTIDSGVKIILTGGAQANNVFWVVGGQTTIETNAVFNGNILDQTAIVLKNGATLNGRALAQTAVTLDSNTITKASSVSEIPIEPATPATPEVETPATPAAPAAPASVVVSNTPGSIIKVNASDRPAVYYVVDGKKYLFVNRATYTTWSSDAGDSANNFATLILVSQAEFDAIPTGGNLIAKPGSLIKFDNSPIIYAVATRGNLYQLADSAAQTALYGSAVPAIIQAGFREGYYDHGNAVGTLTASSQKPD